MTEEQKSCCHANTPSNGICMRQIKYTHLTYAQKKKKKKEKKLLLESFISASEYVLVTTAKHFDGQRKPKIGDPNNRVPTAPPLVTDWMFV